MLVGPENTCVTDHMMCNGGSTFSLLGVQWRRRHMQAILLFGDRILYIVVSLVCRWSCCLCYTVLPPVLLAVVRNLLYRIYAWPFPGGLYIDS